MSERKRYHKDNAPTDDIITLINLVRQNPALYNYKLQPNQRRRSDILSGWQEVSQQMGNKYTVQEVRRKWKNLRDTYHQYRLRSPKCIEGRLSKWRYAKELEFLSKVYQPKLKAHRNALGALLQIKKQPHDDDDDEGITPLGSAHTHGNSQITLVSDEAETFILTAYEESVADDTHVHHHHHHHHQTQHDGSISSIELSQITHDDDELVDDDLDDDHDGQVVDELHVKHELDEDGATGAEVDYEEVCLYEEASGAHCEMGVDASSDVADTKGFHYIDTDEFCIEDMEPEPVTRTSVSVPMRHTHAHPHAHAHTHGHHFGSTGVTVSSASNSVLGGSIHNKNNNNNNGAGGGVITADTKLQNLTLVSTSGGGSAAASSTQQQQQQQHNNAAQQQQLALVDVTEATSTSVTISSTPSVSLNAATVSTTLPTVHAAPTSAANMCNNNQYNSPATTILQLPPLTCPNPAQQQAASISVASSSTLIKEEEQHQLSQALAKRDELDLFFDFLKKKMQCFSKTQITHIQMEFLNCVSRQEVADQDTKD
ncbi:CG12155 [Drosophila busckii]|uniref:CG12155 n=1 Tax=Drosophila busckii TaxID=30019 RepID=A0A0M4ETR6_DROBS|nr:uncharacterized protein LOC108605650 [Drosophila busckii]ALC48347.1 CG12155 [Drosophila busckii]